MWGTESCLFQVFRRMQQKGDRQSRHSQLLWMLQWVVQCGWGNRVITGGSSWWELETFQWTLWRFFPLAATLLLTQTHTVLLAFTPLSHCRPTLPYSSFSDAMHAVHCKIVFCFCHSDVDNECWYQVKIRFYNVITGDHRILLRATIDFISVINDCFGYFLN